MSSTHTVAVAVRRALMLGAITTAVVAPFAHAQDSAGATELETIVMDWLGMMIGLPDDFLHRNPNSLGGGVIQTTASEATFVCLLAGRTEAIKRYQVLKNHIFLPHKHRKMLPSLIYLSI